MFVHAHGFTFHDFEHTFTLVYRNLPKYVILILHLLRTVYSGELGSKIFSLRTKND